MINDALAESPRVVILMATYNGARFIREQLESIVRQSHFNWVLLVHDDGSTDDTVAIVDDFARAEPRIVRLSDEHTGLGAAGNFLWLLDRAPLDADFYACCDQDDVWLEQKLERLLDCLKSEEGPALVYSNGWTLRHGEVTDEPVLTFLPEDLAAVLFLNGGVHGCLMLFNQPLLCLVRNFSGFMVMHDHLLVLAAATFGRLVHKRDKLVHYRKHEDNVTFGYETNFWRKLRGFFDLGRPVVNRRHLKATLDFFDRFRDFMTADRRLEFEAFERYCGGAGRTERLALVLRYGFGLGQSRAALLLKTMLRPAVGEFAVRGA